LFSFFIVFLLFSRLPLLVRASGNIFPPKNYLKPNNFLERRERKRCSSLREARNISCPRVDLFPEEASFRRGFLEISFLQPLFRAKATKPD